MTSSIPELSPEQSATVEALLRRRHPDSDVERIIKKSAESLKSDILPMARLVSIPVANALFGGSTTVSVRGLDDTVTKMLQEGGVGIVSTHYSLADIPLIANLLREWGVNNTYMMGGSNIYRAPVAGLVLEMIFRHSGMIPIRRELLGRAGDSAEGYAYGTLLWNAVHQHASNGSNLVNFWGTGRYRDGVIPNGAYMVVNALASSAKAILPVSVTYEHPAESEQFAKGRAGRSTKALGGAATMINARVRKDTGPAYVAFGMPIVLQKCESDKAAVRKQAAEVHAAVYASLVGNMTLTPTNALATILAMSRSDRTADLRGVQKIFDWFTVLQSSCSLTKAAQEAGVHVSENLRIDDMAKADAFREAYDYFARKGAIRKTPGYTYTFTFGDCHLLGYYANSISGTLKLANVGAK